MSSYRKKQRELDQLGRSVAEVVPWFGFIDDETVLTKDGGLLKCFEYAGFEHEGEEDYEIDRQVRVLEQALRSFDGRISIWWTCIHLEGFEYPKTVIHNKTSEILDKAWADKVQASSNFQTRYILSVFYNANKGFDSFASRIGHNLSKGDSTLAAIFKATFSSFSHGRNIKEILTMLEDNMEGFNEMLEPFLGTFRSAGFQSLRYDEISRIFHALCSPTDLEFPLKPLFYPEQNPILDTFLCSDAIDFEGGNVIRFSNHDEVFGAAITIKEWPDHTHPGMMDGLLALPVKMVVSQCFRFEEHEKAKKYAEGMSSYHNFRRMSPIGYVKQALLKEPGNESPMRVEMAEQARSSVDEIDQGKAYGWYNFTVVIYGNNKRDLDESIRHVVNYLRDHGFISLRESLNLLGAWSSTLPGQWFENVRWHFISMKNLADLAPIRIGSYGETQNRHLSKQYGRDFPALAVFPTVNNRPFFFNLHQGDVGHSIVVGPTGAGKTVFVNFLISQWQKYAPCTTVIFDKDKSCRGSSLTRWRILAIGRTGTGLFRGLRR